MVSVELIRETRDGVVVIEIASPVVHGAWQTGGGSEAFHDELQKEYPNLTFSYCYLGKWEVQYRPDDNSMAEIASLVSRISHEETMFVLGKLQYISNHLIPPLQGSENQQVE